MNSTAEAPEDSTLQDVAVVMLKQWKPLVLIPLAAGALAFVSASSIRPTFTARSVFVPPQQQNTASTAMQSLGALAGLAGLTSGGGSAIKNPADQYVSLMQSATVSNRVIEAFKLQEIYAADTRQEARETLASKVRITAGKRDGLISVEVDDWDPKRAAAMANDYVVQLRRISSELTLTDAQQRRAFFERQMRQAKDSLAKAQSDLQGSAMSEGTIRAEPRAAAEAYASVKAQLTLAEVRLRALRNTVTEESADFKMARSTVQALEEQLRRAGSANGDAASDDYITRYREFKYQETLFELFAKQFEMAKLDESREGAAVQVVDVAEAPERKSKPRRLLITAAAMVVSGFATLVFLLFRSGWQSESSRREARHKN